jgi:hypothetical protein
MPVDDYPTSRFQSEQGRLHVGGGEKWATPESQLQIREYGIGVT